MEVCEDGSWSAPFSFSYLGFIRHSSLGSANISEYRDLAPIWKWEGMVDSKYLLPGIPMQLPTTLGRDNCFKYLQHWFDLGGLKFNKWRRKNGKIMDPVDFEKRWWADSYDDEAADIPAAAQEAMDHVPSTLVDHDSDGPQARMLSPYGSAGALTFRVHDEGLWDEESVEWMDVLPVSDPEDLQPVPEVSICDSAADGVPPCLVPHNPEAMGQWCLHHLEKIPALPQRALRNLRRGIRYLAELPVRAHLFGMWHLPTSFSWCQMHTFH